MRIVQCQFVVGCALAFCATCLSAQEGDRPKPRPVGDADKAPPPRRDADERDFPPPRREDAGPMHPGGRRGPNERGPEGRPPPPRGGERPPFNPQDPMGGRRPPPRDGFGSGFHLEDPEMAELMGRDRELEHETQEATRRLRMAAASEREELAKQLTEIVNKHFDVRQQRRELQLTRMEEELKRLKEVIGKRNEAREQIVKKRLGELIGEQGDLDF